MYHYRKTRHTYVQKNASDTDPNRCNFCHEDIKAEIIHETATTYVIPNRVPYDIFEGRKVTDHLLVIPIEHRETLGDLSDAEKIDHMTIVGQYEAEGYNVFARGKKSISRSVAHQHTHLIKLDDKSPKVIVYTQKPYTLFKL